MNPFLWLLIFALVAGAFRAFEFGKATARAKRFEPRPYSPRRY